MPAHSSGIQHFAEYVVATVRHQLHIVVKDHTQTAVEGNAKILYDVLTKTRLTSSQLAAPPLHWVQFDVDLTRSVHSELERCQRLSNVKLDQ